MDENKNLKNALGLLLIILSISVAVKTFNGFKGGHDGGYGKDINESTIVVSGHGEVNSVPDIASISFSITKEAKTVKEAQAQVTEIENKVLTVLKENKVADKDIKTVNSSFYPKYKYDYRAVYYPQNSVIVGYEVSETIEVKVRDIDSAGVVIEALGSAGVSNLNGPNFAIDDEDVLKAQARKLAIDEAKAKAEALAKDLGVKLGKIVAFNENGNYPTPIYYAKTALEADGGLSSAPALPKGENTISSDVSITYKIR